MHEGWEYTIAALSAGTAGFLGGVTGIGGASLLIFVMAQALDYDQHRAQGTALACFMFPKTLPAVWIMRRRIWALKKPILAATIAFAISAISGALIAFQLSSDALATLFGTVICILGVVALLNRDKPTLPATCLDEVVLPPFLGGKPSEYQSTESETKSCWDTGQVYDSTVEQEHPAADAIIDADHAKFGLQPGISGLTRARSHSEHSEQSYITVSEDTATIITCDTHDATTLPNPGSEEQVHPIIALSVTSLGIMGLIFGLFGGLLGLGAGVVMMPALTILFRLHKDDCRAITLAILCAPSTLGAVIEYSIKGDVKWGIAIVMFFGYLIFNKLGATLGNQLSPQHFPYVMGSYLVLIGTISLLRTWAF